MIVDPEDVQLNDIVVDPDLELRRVVAIRVPQNRFGAWRFRVVPWKGLDRLGRIILEGDEVDLIFYGEVEVVGNAEATPTTPTPPIMYDVPNDELLDRCVEQLREVMSYGN